MSWDGPHMPSNIGPSGKESREHSSSPVTNLLIDAAEEEIRCVFDDI